MRFVVSGIAPPLLRWPIETMRGRRMLLARDLGKKLSQTLFDRSEVQRVLNEHESGRQNHEKLIWTLVNLELFCQRFDLAAASPQTTFADYSTVWGDELNFA